MSRGHTFVHQSSSHHIGNFDFGISAMSGTTTAAARASQRRAPHAPPTNSATYRRTSINNNNNNNTHNYSTSTTTTTTTAHVPGIALPNAFSGGVVQIRYPSTARAPARSFSAKANGRQQQQQPPVTARNNPPPQPRSSARQPQMETTNTIPTTTTTATSSSISSTGPTSASSLMRGSRSGSVTSATAAQQKHQQQLSSSSSTATTTMATQPTAPEVAPPGHGVVLSAAQCLRHFMRCLTDFEQSEVLQYPTVYFLGSSRVEKVRASATNLKNNSGYDDDRGDYQYVLGDHLGYRYELLSVLGKGSFGQVFAAVDHKNQRRVAVKVIRNKKRFHQQALVEVKILEHLREHDKDDVTNTIKPIESFYFRGHLCISFEMLSINLYEFIKANGFQGLSMGLIRRFTVQLLTALQYTYGQRIVHCDMKPENILLRTPTKSSIRVIDFGSSCFENERIYTYIQSRFYRAPEVMLGFPYTTAIDMWSLGCIVAELYTGYPLFPGENELDQMLCIMEIMGVPPRELIDRAPRMKHFFDATTGEPRIVPNSRGRRRRPGTVSLATALNCSDSVFLSFLGSILTWDARARVTPFEAAKHPWVLEGTLQMPPQPQHHQQQQQQALSSSMPSLNVGGGGGGHLNVVRLANEQRESEASASTVIDENETPVF
eukprot:PhM_4_TR372/c2_g1_i2/m.67956/K18669/DYRK2_3_4; dual specificity tyrosine-phosphorylation-regulated kinase 2/3/4